MLSKLKIFVLVLVMIAVPATMALAEEGIDKKEAATVNKGANKAEKISDDVNPAEEAFKEAGEKLNKIVDKAAKDKKFTKKESAAIEKAAQIWEDKAKALRKKCQSTTASAIKIADEIQKEAAD